MLFFDAGNDGKITEKREFVFTEWTEGSTSDMEAMREAFDSNHDGKLTAADAQWGSFKVMVTNADGTVTAKTLTELGITEIKLTPDATHIELPDGSVITGKTSFTQNGVTKTVADTSLSMDAEGHRVVRVESVISGGTFQKEILNTGYKEDGKIAFVQKTLAKADGSHVRHLFDDNGDGVVDRRQDIKTSVANGVKTEWVTNRVNDNSDETNVFSVVDRTKKVTSGNTVTIWRDTNGGGAFEVKETQVTAGALVHVTIERLGPDGVTVLERVVKTASDNGMTRVETKRRGEWRRGRDCGRTFSILRGRRKRILDPVAGLSIHIQNMPVVGISVAKMNVDLPGKCGEHQLRNQEVFYGQREQTDAGISA